MKKTLFALSVLILAAVGPARGVRAGTPPLFSPEPPEAGAAALVETYLPLLASGQFDQALTLNDLRGMRQYLLDRRLSELKTKNPELTPENIEQMSVQIQINDLNPSRLEQILRDVMIESAFEGMTWSVRGYAPAPEGIEGYLASIDAKTADGKEKPILLGIKKLGEQWMVAPEVIEQLTGRQPVVRMLPNLTPPGEVAAAVDVFWKHWQAAEMNEVYEMLGPEYRGRVPLLSFLQQAQEVIAKVGMPSSWAIVQCREVAPAVLGLGVTVQGSMAPMQTIMVFRKTGETWVLEDSQFRPVPPKAPPAMSSASPLARPELRPDLKPNLGTAEPTPPAEPAPAGGAPAPALPDGPIGPESP
jgi:hypothetical protein